MAKGKSTGVKKTAFKFILVDISLVEFEKQVEEDFNIGKGDTLFFAIDLGFSINKKLGVIDITLNYKFNVETTPLFYIKTLSTYKVNDANKNSLLDDNGRHDIFVQLTEGLINHTRGILAYLLKDSFLKKYFIPSIDRKQLGGIIKTASQDHVDEE